MDYLTEDGKQYHTHLEKGDVGRYVLLPGDPFRTDLIASFFDDPVLVAHNREIKTWTGTLDGEKVSVTSTGMGGPSAAIAVEELIKVGADTFIRVGTCGPLKDPEDEKTYDGVIVTGAVRAEGTTYEYAPKGFPAIANRFVVDALARAAENCGGHYLEGISHSKDSFFGEVDPDSSPVGEELKMKWQALQKCNVACSEMECAILFVVSLIRGKRAGAIMDWGRSMENTIKVAVEALRILIKEDIERKKK